MMGLALLCSKRSAVIFTRPVAGHKIYAPKGIGALYIGERAELSPLIHGGGQESGLRGVRKEVAGSVTVFDRGVERNSTARMKEGGCPCRARRLASDRPLTVAAPQCPLLWTSQKRERR